MKVRPGSNRNAAVLFLILSSTQIASAQLAAGESNRIDRLAALAKLWAAVKYFHPYLAYRDNMDWDGALIRAIPKVDAARDRVEYSAAVGGMLNELGDSVTRLLTAPAPAPANSSSSAAHQPAFQRTADGVLVVAMTNYADFEDFVGTAKKLEGLKKELPTASAVVFDLRPAVTPSESEQGNASYGFSSSGLAGALVSVSLDMPGERTACTWVTRRRMAPQAAATARVSTYRADNRSNLNPGPETYR